MKVVLKETVIDRICAKFEEVMKVNREVDYVVVSDEEYRELQGDIRARSLVTYPEQRYTAHSTPTIAQETLEYREFEHRDGRSVRWRSVSHETFMGKPLFVVPAEYMPR